MDQKLTELKHPDKLVIYEDDNHSFTGHQKDMQNELVAWFNSPHVLKNTRWPMRISQRS